MFVLQATGNKAYSWYLFHDWTGQEVDLNCVKKHHIHHHKVKH